MAATQHRPLAPDRHRPGVPREKSVRPKPTHLAPEFAGQFADPSVVASYHLRPPYPSQVIDLLLSLRVDSRPVLDAGTGTGEIARALVQYGVGVDAVDSSPAMLARARQLPGGDHPLLTWVLGSAETAPLRPPYSLIIAAASLHWMEWDVVMPRFRDTLAPGGVLAIVEQRQMPQPWDSALGEIISRYSTNRFYQPYDLVGELVARALFRPIGQVLTAPAAFTQPVADYVESFHARNGFSRDRMDPADAAAFDTACKHLVSAFAQDGEITLGIVGTITWGAPVPS
jgi:SAM-dependent methyltransferase